jgi:hypothetical protein
VISVMQRMTAGNFALDYKAGPISLMLVGSFRPIIGAILAVVIYVLLNTNLVPINVPKRDAVSGDWSQWLPQVYLFSFVAFLAGFSERWAQDMLATGQSVLAPAPAATPKADERAVND